MRQRLSTLFCLLSVVVLGTAATQAQQRDPDTTFKFNLSTPGARSLGLGGAFLALADDATAAYSNPAGLTNLTVGGSEVAVEVRHNQFANSFVDRGHFSAVNGVEPVATNIGVDFEDHLGLNRSEAQSQTTDLSFLSFGYVLPRGLTLALYRHRLADFHTAFETQGPFVDLACDGRTDSSSNGLCIARYLPRKSSSSLDIVNYGLSGAFELKLPALGRLESAISFGVGVSYYDFTLSSFNQFYDLDRFSEVSGRQVGEFYGPPDYTDGNLKFDSLEEGQGDAFAANVGFLWKLGRQQRWSIGGVFRQGATFDTGRDLRTCSPQGGTDEGQVDPRSPIVCDFDTALRAGKFTIPDTFGLGFAFRSAEGKTKIALDLNRVRYSQRLIDFTFGLDPASGLKARDFRIEDADQIHLGVERVVLVVESLFVGTARFGAWREPFHELEYSGGDEATAALIRRAKDAEIHYSAGFGLVIKEDYQLDFAADLADGANTYSFSLVKFF